MHCDPEIRRLKFCELAKLVRHHGIIALQEVHGCDVSIALQNSGLLKSHVFLSSHPRDNRGVIKEDAGGVAFLARGIFVLRR